MAKITILNMRKLISSLLFTCIATITVIAQNQQEIIKNMKEEVSFLASDQLEGRQSGENSCRIY